MTDHTFSSVSIPAGFPMIHVGNVKKYFKDVKAVDGIDLEIQRGEFLFEWTLKKATDGVA